MATGDRWWAEAVPADAESKGATSERRRDQPGEAMEWRLGSLQYENGIITEGGLMRARAQANRMRRVPSSGRRPTTISPAPTSYRTARSRV